MKTTGQRSTPSCPARADDIDIVPLEDGACAWPDGRPADRRHAIYKRSLIPALNVGAPPGQVY